MPKKWIYKQLPDNETIETLSKEINVSKPLATVLCQRDMDSYSKAKSFFNPSLDQLHDPFLMKGMTEAVERIEEALGNDEKVLVYGDYDVDGTTSVALFFNFLNSFYHNCSFYIPDRYKEGYGLSKQSIDWALDNNFSLIITLDCGIKSVNLIGDAQKQGIDFIICDHHLPGAVLPNAVAVLDPKQNDCPYPFKELSGCGIGFKLMQAICSKRPHLGVDPMMYLDLVVVSIASDIVPIVGENRALSFLGLRHLESSPRPGLKALLRLASCSSELTITDIVFGLAPRINAAGRMGHAHTAVDLLLAKSEEEANHFAQKLDLRNLKRKDVDSEITGEALSLIKSDNTMVSAKSTVLFKNHWHKGVIGIVASRCIEHYHRPTIIFTESNNMATGSARSVNGFDVYEAISKCDHLLTQYGGHKYAAGLTLEIENIEPFRKKFEEVVSSSISDDMLIPQIEVDIELAFDQIKPNFLKVLKRMAPYGPENLRPVFVSKDVFVHNGLTTMKDKHIKFIAEQQGNSKNMQVVGFNMSEYLDDLRSGKLFKIAYSIEESTFRGIKSIQLNLKDIQFE